MFRLDSGFLPCFEEPLETLVLETLDHAPKRNPLRYTTQPFPHITFKLTGGNAAQRNYRPVERLVGPFFQRAEVTQSSDSYHGSVIWWRVIT